MTPDEREKLLAEMEETHCDCADADCDAIRLARALREAHEEIAKVSAVRIGISGMRATVADLDAALAAAERRGRIQGREEAEKACGGVAERYWNRRDKRVANACAAAIRSLPLDDAKEEA